MHSLSKLAMYITNHSPIAYLRWAKEEDIFRHTFVRIVHNEMSPVIAVLLFVVWCSLAAFLGSRLHLLMQSRTAVLLTQCGAARFLSTAVLLTQCGAARFLSMAALLA